MSAWPAVESRGAFDALEADATALPAYRAFHGPGRTCTLRIRTGRPPVSARELVPVADRSRDHMRPR
jgi:hypothetical protein